jgi:hypothetical protein
MAPAAAADESAIGGLGDVVRAVADQLPIHAEHVSDGAVICCGV